MTDAVRQPGPAPGDASSAMARRSIAAASARRKALCRRIGAAPARHRSIDRSAAPRAAAAYRLVLLVAALLVGAAAGIVLVGGSNAEPYILAFLAVLATIGVFSLFALACGILRLPPRRPPIR